MHATSRTFKQNADHALADAALQKALGHIKRGFVEKRSAAAARLPEFEALRDQARDIKDHVLNHLDHYLERFEARVRESGGTVHWCRTPEEARQAILSICRSVDAKTVTNG